MNLEEKKIVLQELIRQKLAKVRQIDEEKQLLMNEVLETNGQLKLIEEMQLENKKKDDSKSTTKSLK